ncbi:MAG: UDP-4-amino-4,6-dideoxy-N-acetyl-beta-L-altrosamine transaminase [Gallionella sp.]
MIPYGKHYIDEEDIQAVAEVLRSGVLTQGPAVEAFEQAIAKYVGVKYAIALSSGTAALHLAALVAGVGPGKSLVTSPITFVASANAARYVGGRVLFSDIDPSTVNMSPDSLEQVLKQNSDVRAVVPVHFAGLPCDMPAIKAAADRAGAVVIEDAAHALGAIYPDGSRVGSCANSLMTIFSFHPVKAIAAGEGGMITTNDEGIYRKLLRLRSHGINKLNDTFLLPEQAFTDDILNPWYYEMQELGFHYRITDMQCGLALSQLKKLDKFISRRRELANKYDEAFANLNLCRPAQMSGRESSGHHLYVLRIDFESLGVSRAQFMRALREFEIITQVHYMPVPMHPYYRNLGVEQQNFPNALKYYEEALSIPLYYGLTDEQHSYVIEKLSLK